MRKTKGIVLALLGVAILACSLVLSAPHPGHGDGRDRSPEPPALRPKVVPVPLGASTDSAPPPPPRLHHEKFTPLQEAGLFQFRADEPDAILIFPIPPGKRFVLEHVSLRAELKDGRRATALLTTTTGGGYATHVLPLASQGRFGDKGEVFVASQAIKAYADGGTSVQVRVERSAASEADTGWVSITGYLLE